MKTISVNAYKRDPKCYGAQKYDNNEEWNIPGGMAPNGVSATRYLRKTAPNISQLTPLAAWLAEHCPGYVGGKMPHPQLKYRVQCFNGRTEAEQIMHEARTRLTVNCQRYADEASAVHAAENLFKCYAGYMDGPQKIDDWLFPFIEPNQTDEDYWNIVAGQIIAAGTNRVVIGDAEWRA